MASARTTAIVAVPQKKGHPDKIGTALPRFDEEIGASAMNAQRQKDYCWLRHRRRTHGRWLFSWRAAKSRNLIHHRTPDLTITC